MPWTSAPAPNTFGGARRIQHLLMLDWDIRIGALAARLPTAPCGLQSNTRDTNLAITCALGFVTSPTKQVLAH